MPQARSQEIYLIEDGHNETKTRRQHHYSRKRKHDTGKT